MARFGPGEDDFTSGIGAARTDPALAEATRRAIAAGLYEPSKPLHPGMQQAVHILASMVLDELEKPDEPKRIPIRR